jgi:hypothetical protein
MLIYFLRTYIQDPEQAVREGCAAAEAAKRMVAIGKELVLPADVIDSLQFEAATFAVLAEIRQHICLGLDAAKLVQLKKRLASYRTQYPQHYRLSPTLLDKPLPAPSKLLQRIIRLVVRQHAAYRVIDKIILLTSPLQRIAIKHYFKKTNPELTQQSMGIDAVFK